jgi:membrane protein implicated in regulation of membrane protease activity
VPLFEGAMNWWFWVVGFFGAGALRVGALKLLGWGGPAWAEWLVFTALSVASLALFRRPLMRRFSLGKSKPVDQLQGERALVTEDVAPGGVGKAEMRGASWTARTSGALVLARGHRCIVERVEGLTLWLKAE